jgi:hypothetical protein
MPATFVNELDAALGSIPDTPVAGQPLEPKPITASDISGSLSPMTTEAARESMRKYGPAVPYVTKISRSLPLTKEQLFQQENAAAMPAGVEGPSRPIETRAGIAGPEQGAFGNVPLVDRYQLGRRKDFLDQYTYLEEKYPGKVRVSKDGRDFILTLPDDTGGEKDVLVNDRSINLGDFAQLAAKTPELAGSLLGMAVARRVPGLGNLGPKLSFARDVTASSIGMETASAVQQASVKSEQGQPIDPGRILMTGLKDLPIDIGFGYLTAGFAKTLNEAFKFVQAPFSFSKTAVQTEGLAAADRLEQELGVKLRHSPADVSGSPILAMGQKMIESLPSSAASAAKKLADIQASKDATFRAITAGVKSDEEVGATLVNELQGIRNATEGESAAAAKAVEVKGTGDLQATTRKIAGEKVGPGSGFSPIEKGKVTRSSLETVHAADMTEKNVKYGDVFSEPAAQQRNIPTKPILDEINDLRKNVPSRAVTSQATTVNQYGGTGTATVKGKEPVHEFIHPEVKRFLSAELDPEMNLGEMIKMRSMLYDEAAQGEAVQGIPTRHIRQIAGSITDAIKAWLAAPPQTAVKTKLKIAEDFYKSNVLRWEEPGFHDLFRKSTQGAGYVSDEAVLERLKSKPSQFLETLNRVKGLPGETALRGSVMDDLLNKSTMGLGSDTIDGKSFLAALDDYRLGPNKDIADAVFGSRLHRLVAAARRIAIGQGRITLDQAKELLASDAPILDMVKRMYAATAAQSTLYKNQLIKEFTSGTLDINTVNAEKALNSFMDVGTESDIKWLSNIARANPDLSEQLERKTLEQILRKAGPKIDDVSLRKVLNDSKMNPKYIAMIGQRKMDMMQDLATALSPYRITEQYGAGTGIFSKGSATGKLIKAAVSLIMLNPKGGVKEIQELVGIKMIGLALTNPTVESWFLNTPSSLYKDLGKAVAVSEPFLKALNDDVSDSAQKVGIVNSIRHAFGFDVPAGKSQRPTDEQKQMQDFIKSGNFPK